MGYRVFILLAGFFLMAATLGEDGLYDDPLFHDTFLDLGEDASEAASNDQVLMVIVEQRGCPYCKEMHEVNFARDDIRDVIGESFYPIQLDLWGAREVTDFNGQAMEEREFLAEQNVQFTPTTIFYNGEGDEIFRMPGYFKPFHHFHALQYVATGAYQDEPNFQRYLQDIFAEYEAKGEEAPVWD